MLAYDLLESKQDLICISQAKNTNASRYITT